MSRNVVSLIGAVINGRIVAPDAEPRKTMYPAKSVSVLASQIRLMAPSLATAASDVGAFGGNVSVGDRHAAGDGSLATESCPG